MISGALRDRMAGIGVMVAAGLLLVTAWVLGVAAVVVLTAQKLGTAGALLAVTGGLVLLALILVWGTRARNRSSAAERATTRALWVATAVNAASTILRRDAPTEASLPPADTSSKGHRSLLLIAGGLVLILLAFLIPSGKEDAPASDAEVPDPDPAPDPGSVA